LTWIYGLSVIACLVWLFARIGAVIEAFTMSLTTRTAASWDEVALPLVARAVRRGLPLLALILGAPILSMSPPLADIVSRATSLLLVGFCAFVLYQMVDAAAAFVLRQHRIDVTDNLRARSI